jgi:hypothetical protein
MAKKLVTSEDIREQLAALNLEHRRLAAELSEVEKQERADQVVKVGKWVEDAGLLWAEKEVLLGILALGKQSSHGQNGTGKEEPPSPPVE